MLAARRGCWKKVFHVDERNTAGVAGEVVARLPAAEGHHAAVDLELYERRVGFLEEQIVADPAGLLGELEIVIVIDELQSGALRLGADAIGEIRGASGFIQAHSSPGRCRAQATARRVVRAECM